MTIAAGLCKDTAFNEFVGTVVADVFVVFVVDAFVIFAIVDAITAILAVVLTIAIGIYIIRTRAAILAEELSGNLLCLVRTFGIECVF